MPRHHRLIWCVWHGGPPFAMPPLSLQSSMHPAGGKQGLVQPPQAMLHCNVPTQAHGKRTLVASCHGLRCWKKHTIAGREFYLSFLPEPVATACQDAGCWPQLRWPQVIACEQSALESQHCHMTKRKAMQTRDTLQHACLTLYTAHHMLLEQLCNEN